MSYVLAAILVTAPTYAPDALPRTPNPPEPEPTPVVTTAVPYDDSCAIPCHIIECESGGDYTAENPVSSASGRYQLIQSTADAAAQAIGHPELVGIPASQWPPALQDEAAAWLYADGAGASHWAACL